MKFPSNVALTFAYQGATCNAMTPAAAIEAGVPEDAVLGAYRDLLKSRVDATAESLRSSITTPGSGQAMEYLEAQQQAFAALADQAGATAQKYPMLAASVGIDVDPSTGQPAADVVGVARSVHAAYGQWNAAGSAIRAARLAGKKAIEEAATPEAADAALAAINWPPLG